MSRAVLAALPLLLLGACVTTGDRPVDNKAAAQANVQLGVEYLKQGNLQVAKDKLDRAEKQDPDNPDVYWTMAVLQEQLNQPRQAEQDYRKAMDLAPEKPEIQNTYAAFLCKQGEVDRALPIFEKLIANKLYAQPYVAATNAGMCLRDDKRNADAQRYFERAVALGPGYVDAVVGLADLQIVQGKADAALQTARSYMQDGNKSPDVLVVAVRASVAQHDCPNAQLYARLLRRDFPNSGQAAALPQQLGACGGTAN
ncbi:MAG TPA: type IV pilus biogenesis/stability protein PilW [Steroidobacteraceae bacterium]|nr:type IV pilus biogenesis/stability protein PilW [Steroidobacteraceae bacterium]